MIVQESVSITKTTDMGRECVKIVSVTTKWIQTSAVSGERERVSREGENRNERKHTEKKNKNYKE